MPGREEVEERGESPADEEARDASSRESRVGAAAYETWAIARLEELRGGAETDERGVDVLLADCISDTSHDARG